MHRLVLEAFVGPRPRRMVARHLDGDQSNNAVGNLAWGTPSENATDRLDHGRTPRGEGNAKAKLTDDQVREIRSLLSQGELPGDVAKRYGVSRPTIIYIRDGKRWGWLV